MSSGTVLQRRAPAAISGGARRTDAYSGMKAGTSWPSRASSCTSAPATSASPPVFAYGMISELKMHSFSGAMSQV